jgi:hypothetical protein
MPVILALGRLKQEDCKFKASLGYIARTCLKIQKQDWVGRQREENQGVRTAETLSQKQAQPGTSGSHL